jgi:membrane-anchored glycerophosphoryl diester phosphodiesterase (GDPDase)
MFRCTRKYDVNHHSAYVSIVNILPQDGHFTAQYFIDFVAMLLAEAHSVQSERIARRRLQSHIDNFRNEAIMAQETAAYIIFTGFCAYIL